MAEGGDPRMSGVKPDPPAEAQDGRRWLAYGDKKPRREGRGVVARVKACAPREGESYGRGAGSTRVAKLFAGNTTVRRVAPRATVSSRGCAS